MTSVGLSLLNDCIKFYAPYVDGNDTILREDWRLFLSDFHHNCDMSTYFSETRQYNVMNIDSFVMEMYTDGQKRPS